MLKNPQEVMETRLSNGIRQYTLCFLAYCFTWNENKITNSFGIWFKLNCKDSETQHKIVSSKNGKRKSGQRYGSVAETCLECEVSWSKSFSQPLPPTPLIKLRVREITQKFKVQVAPKKGWVWAPKPTKANLRPKPPGKHLEQCHLQLHCQGLGERFFC